MNGELRTLDGGAPFPVSAIAGPAWLLSEVNKISVQIPNSDLLLYT